MKPDITMNLEETLELDYYVNQEDPTTEISVSSYPEDGQNPDLKGFVKKTGVFDPKSTGRHKLNIKNKSDDLVIDVLDIPNKSSIFAWWDLSDESTVQKNGSGGLKGVSDKSGNDKNLNESHAVGDAIDDYGSIKLNGRKGGEIKNNGQGGGWEIPSWGISSPFTFYSIMGFNQSSYDASGNREVFRIFDSDIGGTIYGQFDEVVTDNNDYRMFNGGESLYSGAGVSTNARLYGGIYDGSNSEIFVGEKTNTGSISSFSGTSDAISVMRNDNQTTFGRIYEMVFYQGRKDNYTEFRRYVNEKYGV